MGRTGSRDEQHLPALRVLVGVCSAMLLVAGQSKGETYLVRPDGSGDFPNLVAAAKAAQSGDEILLGDGTFSGEGNRNVLFHGRAVSIRSESGDPSRCIIDSSDDLPDEPNRALYFRFTGTSEFVVQGVTITGGDEDIGGGILAWQSNPTIIDCIFVANKALESGALHFQESSATVEGCVIAGNIATEYPGGGIFCCVNSSIRVRGCTIVGNEATSWGPGGIASWVSSSVEIENSIVVGSSGGEGVGCDETSVVTIACSNVFGNLGGDWVGCIKDQGDLEGNISFDPLFCDAIAENFTIRDNSPCSAKSSACGLIGALPVGCEALTVLPLSWGKIKAGYRRLD